MMQAVVYQAQHLSLHLIGYGQVWNDVLKISAIRRAIRPFLQKLPNDFSEPLRHVRIQVCRPRELPNFSQGKFKSWN